MTGRELRTIRSHFLWRIIIMAIKVGINGFGRIGRVVLRIMIEHPEQFDICGINLRKADLDYMVYMIKYDSVFRQFNGTVEHEGGDLVVNGHKIKVFSQSDAAMIPWESCGAEYVIESTGAYNNTEKASRHFKGGAKKVILTAPGKDEVTPTFVMGVNHMLLHSDMKVVSNASCTTNCLAPMAKALNDCRPIMSGIMTTVHAYTGDQMILDGPQRKGDLRRSRAGACNIVPNSTGAAKAIGLVIPELNGKLIGSAQRVPVPTGSTTILVAVVKGKDVTKESINAAMKAAASQSFGYNEDPIVSSDVIGMKYGSLFDATQTMVAKIDDDTYQVQVVSWYDNENSYTSQMVRTIKYFAELSK